MTSILHYFDTLFANNETPEPKVPVG